MVSNLRNTTVTFSMYDFVAIIFYVVFATCLVTLAFAFRGEIAIIIRRTMIVTGTMIYWVKFKRMFCCCAPCNEDSDEEVIQNMGDAKVTYEIYNPQTGKIDD